MGRTALAGVALLAALAGGCTDQPASATGPSGAPGPDQSSMGAVDVALAVPPKFNIATINYQLTNTGYSKSGSFDVSQTQTLSAVVGGIPAGTGYTLALSATDTASKFTGCTGSSPVTVVAGSTTPVSVAMDCHLPQQVIVSTPNVPVPMSAVALLAIGLLAGGLLTQGRRERRPSRRE